MEDIKDLKSRAYDILAQIDFLQRELQATNQKIAERSQQKDAPPEAEEKSE